MGDHFSSSSKYLVGSFLRTLQKTSKKIKMKFFAIVCFVGYTQAFLVRREADAEPEADADAAGYGIGVSHPATAVSAPVCNSVPVKTCNPREIKHPRQVCHDEHDTIVDTTITEHCEEIITTKCEQTSTQSRHSSAVVGTDSKVVSTGVVASPEVTVAHGPVHGAVAGYGAVGGVVAAAPAVATGVVAGYGAVAHGAVAPVAAHAVWKREAEADAGADAAYAHAYASPVATSAPVCTSVPVKQCNNVETPVPRTVVKKVCKEVIDIQIIEDCTETITTECTQTQTTQQHSSAVVGHDTKVGPSAVVATAHAAPAVAVHAAPAVAVHAAPAVAVAGVAAAPAVAVAGHAVAAGPVVAGYAGTGYGLAGYGGW